jgi:RNA polymerase sigma-70 factor, ECF subfamily
LQHDEATDEDLVRAFQRGEVAAFSLFVDRHTARLYRLASVWLFDRSLAADVVQETLTRSYRGLWKFRFRAEPATWLARVCRNICHEENRYTAKHLPMHDLTAMIEAGGEVADTASSDGRLPLALLDRLPPRQRDVVVLRVLEGLSVAETARVMGCRAGTVKAHLHKALANLRIEWNGDVN